MGMRLFKPADFYGGLIAGLARFYFAQVDDICSMQNTKLRMSLKNAQKDIGFYKELFSRHNFDVNKFKGIKDMGNIPFTDSNSYFSHTYNQRVRQSNSCMHLRSSGTRGVPKDIYLSGFDWTYSRRLSYLRMIFLSGVSPFCKNLYLRSLNTSYPIRKKWFWKVGLMREKALYSGQPKHRLAETFSQYCPDVFNCLTAEGVALAQWMKDKGNYRHRAKYIFTTGEMLSAKDRYCMSEALGSKVIDFYANTEVGIIAWQCSESNAYHINTDQLYVEIIDGVSPCKEGQPGEVVLTTLTPCLSPLIRYRTGDIAVLERGKCKCKSYFPRLLHLKGRKNDFLTDSKGEKVSPYTLMSTLDAVVGIKKYQIIQQSPNLVTVNVKLINDTEDYVMNNVKSRCHAVLGNNMQIEINTNFKNAHGNKRQTIINKMANVN